MKSNLPPKVTDSMIEAQALSAEEETKFDELVTELEEIVNKSCLYTVVEALTQICYLKEDHLRINWQAHFQANLWQEASEQLEKLNIQV